MTRSYTPASPQRTPTVGPVGVRKRQRATSPAVSEEDLFKSISEKDACFDSSTASSYTPDLDSEATFTPNTVSIPSPNDSPSMGTGTPVSPAEPLSPATMALPSCSNDVPSPPAARCETAQDSPVGNWSSIATDERKALTPVVLEPVQAEDAKVCSAPASSEPGMGSGAPALSLKSQLKPWIARATARIMRELISRNEAVGAHDPEALDSAFRALEPPPITIHGYMERIVTHAKCSDECFVCALIYIDRIIQTRPTFVISSFNIHRLLITSVMLSAKFMDDIYYNNAYYAKVGGVPTDEINGMELEFLFLVNFTLFVQPNVFSLCKYCLASPLLLPPRPLRGQAAARLRAGVF